MIIYSRDLGLWGIALLAPLPHHCFLGGVKLRNQGALPLREILFSRQFGDLKA